MYQHPVMTLNAALVPIHVFLCWNGHTCIRITNRHRILFILFKYLDIYIYIYIYTLAVLKSIRLNHLFIYFFSKIWAITILFKQSTRYITWNSWNVFYRFNLLKLWPRPIMGLQDGWKAPHKNIDMEDFLVLIFSRFTMLQLLSLYDYPNKCL